MKHPFAILLVFFALSINVFAVGAPDPSFYAYGKVNAGFGRGKDHIDHTALCADGSVVAFGLAGADYALMKFTPQGALDSTFGNGGVTNLALPVLPYFLSSSPVAIAVGADCGVYVAGGHGPDMSVGKYSPDGYLVQIFDGGETGFLLNGRATAIAVQPDGSVLVAGNQGSEYRDFAIYRYLPSGALDINFGNGGRSFTHMGWKGGPTSVRAESGGKIVITGAISPDASPTPLIFQSLIARYNFDGSPDTTFAGTGVFVNPVRTALSETYRKSFTLPDGRILAAGSNGTKLILSRFNVNGLLDKFFGSRGTILFNLAAGFPEFQNDGSLFVIAENYSIYKFNPSGRADLTFGAQGVVTLPEVGILALTAAPDGRLFAGGIVNAGFVLGGGGGITFDTLLYRLNGDGSVDEDFGKDGRVSKDIGDFYSRIKVMALQPDGKIVSAGGMAAYGTGSASGFIGTGLARYNPNGTVDLSFGDRGKVYLPATSAIVTVNGIAVQADGKIVVVGDQGINNSSYGVMAMRLNADGSVDTTFGTLGIYVQMQTGLHAGSVAVQPDGKIVIGGNNGVGDFTVIRLTADGAPDPNFGINGMAFTESGYDYQQSMVLQPDGKILLAGSGNLVRLHPNGDLDILFGRRGKVPMSNGNFASFSSIALHSDGSIIAAGVRRDTRIPVVTKFNSSGMRDTAFANYGVFTDTNSFLYGYSASLQLAGDGSMYVAVTDTNINVLKLSPAGVRDPAWGVNGMMNSGLYTSGDPVCLLDAGGKLLLSGDNSGAAFIARYTTQ